MRKIFGYELRRLLWNRLFFGVLLTAAAYGWLTLTDTVIFGVADTAPFSPWSFGYYLSRVLPLICLGELLFLAFFHTAQARKLKPIVTASPVDPLRYAAAQGGAALTATLLLSLCVAALAGAFDYALFGWTDFAGLLAPMLLTLPPAIIFCFGAGLFAGRLHPKAVYPFAAAVFLLAFLPLPSGVSLSLVGFYAEYPLALGGLDPAFQIPAGIVAQRCAYTLAGIAGLAAAGSDKLRRR